MFHFHYKSIDFSHKLDYASSPEDEYAKHLHAFCEVLVFIGGDCEYNVDCEKKKLVSGDIVFIQPGKFHFATINRNVIYERYVLKFPESMIPSHIKEKLFSSSPFYHMDKEHLSLFRSLDAVKETYNDEDFFCYSSAKLTEFLIWCNNVPTYLFNEENPSVVLQVIKYIEGHLEDNVSLTDISDALSYSESYISNCFKKEMHIPIMKYIRDKKIIYAHSLILSGNKPQSVAEKLNFNDYSTFYRQYLKVIGSSPSKDK